MKHPIYLTEEEIQGITNRKQHTAQIRALIGMGIDYKTRPDGSPLVSRLAYEPNKIETSTPLLVKHLHKQCSSG